MAIESLDLALQSLVPPIYVYHEIVHNKYVVDHFRERGVKFVDDLADVPRGATLLFSAHGVSPEVRRVARERNLRAIDATCPLVTKVHFWFEGADSVLITAGASAPEQVVEQCVDWLRQRFGATVESRSIREESVSFPLPRELRNIGAGM
jgi:4-hydroxy-3-methylbut-2-enyl diphosphate reductase IspH